MPNIKKLTKKFTFWRKWQLLDVENGKRNKLIFYLFWYRKRGKTDFAVVKSQHLASSVNWIKCLWFELWETFSIEIYQQKRFTPRKLMINICVARLETYEVIKECWFRGWKRIEFLLCDMGGLMNWKINLMMFGNWIFDIYLKFRWTWKF